MKFSFIVPVFKVEKYVVRCIQSLLDQDIDDYEIVVVNDGTPDRSVELIKENFNDPKIRIINRENGGLSAARNTGIDYSKGDYIWFVDSDDFIEKNCLSNVIKKVDGKDLLVFTCGIAEGDEKKKYTYKGTYDMKAVTPLDLFNSYIACAPYYVYSRKLIMDNNLRFKIGVLHEDMEFTPRALFKSQSFSFYEKPLYHQVFRVGSITHTFNMKRANDVLDNANSLYQFYIDNINCNNSKSILVGACKCIIYGVIYSRNMNDRDRRDYIHKIVNNKSLDLTLKNSPLKKYQIQRIMMKLSPSVYLRLFDYLYSRKYSD